MWFNLVFSHLTFRGENEKSHQWLCCDFFLSVGFLAVGLVGLFLMFGLWISGNWVSNILLLIILRTLKFVGISNTEGYLSLSFVVLFGSNVTNFYNIPTFFYWVISSSEVGQALLEISKSSSSSSSCISPISINPDILLKTTLNVSSCPQAIILFIFLVP